MTDRDHFAAAALTGLLSDKQNHWPTAMQWEYLLKHAFVWADAMLRERGTPFQADCVAGNCPEIGCPPPVAETPPSQQVAETCRSERQDDAPPEPFAAGVTLTDAEREAILRLCEAVTEWSDYDRKTNGCHADDDMAAVAVARGLLARLGGGA
jgi:hypothetical protein